MNEYWVLILFDFIRLCSIVSCPIQSNYKFNLIPKLRAIYSKIQRKLGAQFEGPMHVFSPFEQIRFLILLINCLEFH